jgi:hypothetical protein
VIPGSLLVCRDARAAHWQLGPLPPARGRLTLVAWSQRATTRDSGVPRDVAGILAHSWTSLARVTFPSSPIGITATEAWSPSDVGLIRALAAQGTLERTLAYVRGAPVGATLISTRQADIATRVFEDAGFPWWLQGQAVLLSDPDADPPDIDEPNLLALFEDDWADRAATLAGIGVLGVVRPGVDGDVAGLLALSGAFDTRLLQSLEREARRAGMTCAIVPETALSATSVGDLPDPPQT